jgi:hypothetical protein
MGSTELVVSPRGGQIVSASDFMPLMSVEEAIQRKKQMNAFIQGVMTEGEDYGPMPGDNKKEKKKVLLKPGAEKLTSIFGLAPRYLDECIIEDWTGREHAGEPLFYYRYKCQLYRGDRFMGEAVGSSNSWEAKHRYRWVSKDQIPTGLDIEKLQSRGSVRSLFEFMFAFDKRETTGQYGKPEEHWAMFEKALQDGTARNAKKTTKKGEQPGYEIDVDTTLYRIPNEGAADVVNTCQKIAQKRALVAAVLIVTNCSDAFTQDLEDSEPPIDTGGHPTGTQAAADHVAQTKINGGKIDPALASALSAIDKNIGAFPTACESLYKLLAEKHGGAGAKAYDDICMKFSEKFPKGCKDKQAMKDCIKDLWMEYEKPVAQPVQEVLS